MFRELFCTPAWTVLLALTWASAAWGDAWVERMLAEKEHDFGTIEKGAEAVYRFPVRNLYKHEIELVRVRTSCGCTDARLENAKLQPGQTGELVARLNTTSFTGPHEATLTVEAAWDDHGVRRSGEASVRVQGDIRSGVVVEPETVTFCNVRQGTVHERRIRVSSDGKESWNVKNVLCDCSNLEVDLTETVRTADRVVYEMLVRLKKTAPPGFFREQLLLIPDHATKPKIPLDVTGQVVPEISVSPVVLFLEDVDAGKAVKNVVVRGNEPFEIAAVKLDGEVVEFKTSTDRPSRRHVVELSLRLTGRGRTTKSLEIETSPGDDSEEKFTVQTSVFVRSSH